MTKHPEETLYELQKTVATKFFKKNPIKRFPEDFLTKKVKNELFAEAGGKRRTPCVCTGVKSVKGGKGVKSGKGVKRRSRSLATMYRSWPGGQSHQVRHRFDKIDVKKAMESYNYYKKLEAKMKYEVIAMPEGKFELKIDKKVQIRPEKWPMPLEFDSFDKAKYVLYSRRKGPCVCNLPKDESIVKKAVQKYEKYLKKMRDKLVKAFMARNADRKLAEAMAGQVFPCKIY